MADSAQAADFGKVVTDGEAHICHEHESEWVGKRVGHGRGGAHRVVVAGSNLF